MVEQWLWRPHVSKDVSVSYRTREVSFGDGYEQSVGDGINTSKRSLGVKFNVNRETLDSMIAFLDRHAGWKSFEFDGRLYKAGSFSQSQVGPDNFMLTTTFKEAHHA